MHPYPAPVAAGPRPGVAGRPPSTGKVTLGVGVAGACVAALSFLVAGIMEILVHRDGTEQLPDDALMAVLGVLTSIVTGLLLIFAIGLILLGSDAGRSAIVWAGAAALPWALLVSIDVAVSAYGDRDLFSGSFVALGITVGVACGVGAVGGLTTAMIALGIPPGRRWLAANVLARGDLSWPPAPLVAAGRRFTAGAVLGVAGCVALLVLTPLANVNSDGSLEAMIAWTTVLVLFVGVPQAFGLWGVRLARRGRRSGANIARASGVFVIYGLEIFVVLGVFDAMAGIQDDGAVLPGAAVVPLAALFTCVVILGLVQWVAGLAGLADPRSEQFMRAHRVT